MKEKILIVDDDKDICVTLSKILISKGYEVNVANNSDIAMNEIKTNPVDLILLDVWLEGSKKNGLELLKLIKNFNPNTPVILISGHANIDMAVKSIKQGAFYFIEKPFKSEKLFLIIERALENVFLKNKYESFKNDIQNEELIGNTTVINNLRKKIKNISNSNARILISGESGSGKNLVAKIIHNLSTRSEKPFITINCALLNDRNFDKSFFGDFNEANRSLGYIQKAGQGTIYLKEICDLEYHIQGKITNFLQKETFSLETPDGKNNFNANIRIISSTSKDINQEIENKRLRKDLLYRINVASINLPSIKKRREDIPLIIDYFIKKKKEETKKNIRLSDDVYPLLQTINWPGNVTQIRNFVDWLFILVKSSNKDIDVITTSMLPSDLLDEKKDTNKIKDDDKSIMNLPIKDARKHFEKQYLINQVNRFGGNISKTASFIGMERSALHRKIKEIGIKK